MESGDDPYLPSHFTADTLDGKADVKRALLETAGLPTDPAALARPAIGLVSRLTDQKGFDLIAAAAAGLIALDAAWVMLGSGEPHYERFWQDLHRRFPERVAVSIGFNERLAHLIEGGSDLFLMPSRFEPCGLNQMYSLRYGTIPVVRATGGLEDTVKDEAQAGRDGHGIHVSGVHSDGAAPGRRPGARGLPEAETLEGLTADRHGPGSWLGRFGPGVCQSVQRGRDTEGERWHPKKYRR